MKDNKDKVLDYNKMSYCLAVVSTVVTIIGFAVSLYMNNTILSIATVIIIIMTIIVVIKTNKQKTDLIHKVDNLESLVWGGDKILETSVKIYFRPNEKKYIFIFYKKYRIINDGTSTSFTGQFYCNKFLNDEQKAKKYYKKYIINWSDIKFYASIECIHPDGNVVLEKSLVKVKPIHDSGNYMKYRIHYTKLNDNLCFSTTKGTIIELEYGYEVFSDFWGSYLNRTISYFNETCNVKLYVPAPHEKAKRLDIRVYKLNEFKNYEPEVRDDILVKSKVSGNNNTEFEINIPNKKGTYRIHWDSEKVFQNMETTFNTKDKSETTFK